MKILLCLVPDEIHLPCRHEFGKLLPPRSVLNFDSVLVLDWEKLGHQSKPMVSTMAALELVMTMHPVLVARVEIAYWWSRYEDDQAVGLILLCVTELLEHHLLRESVDCMD